MFDKEKWNHCVHRNDERISNRYDGQPCKSANGKKQKSNTKQTGTLQTLYAHGSGSKVVLSVGFDRDSSMDLWLSTTHTLAW